MIAQQLIDHLDLKQGSVAKCEIAGPGFINFFMESASLASVIGVVLQENENYGRSDAGQGLKVDVEYVSANRPGICIRAMPGSGDGRFRHAADEICGLRRDARILCE